MKIIIKDNTARNVGGDFVRLEGLSSESSLTMEGNTVDGIGGNVLSVINFNDIRAAYPQLNITTDEELSIAARSIVGKSYDVAVEILQNTAAFTSIVLADWRPLLDMLGWS